MWLISIRFIHVHTQKAKYVATPHHVIHPVLTVLSQPAPETEEDMMIEIFAYTERVVNMTRPRKLLYMAIGTGFSAQSGGFLRTDLFSQMVSHPAQK